MKKIVTLLLLTAFFYSANSQMRLGILGGPHSSSVIEKNNIPGWDNTIKPFYSSRSGFNIGLIGEIPLGLSKKYYFQPGIFYMSKGRKYQRYYDTTRINTDTLFRNINFYTNYIDIPLNLVVKVPLGRKSNFMVSAGPYVSFFYNGKVTDETRIAMNDTTVHYNKDESNIEVGKNTNNVHTFDFGVNARAGFEFGNLLLTAFISQGLINFYNASYNSTYKHKVVGASVGFWLNKRPVVTNDRDGDGVIDKLDMCPDVAGSPATGGCPDRDGDGIADDLDKCPDQAGPARNKGCPIADRDKDGINDEEDQCPDTPGVAKYHGCPIPDTDHDGINDEEDMCPDKPGPVEFNGCPIPDTDGDGVNDKDDKCPTVPGTRENNGCPVIKKEIIEKVNYAAKKIFFATKSDVIVPSSFSALDKVVAVLKANTTLKLFIEGHSDNVGTPAFNLALSQKRADAVKNYLVKKGIDVNRLQAKGYGMERPVADNSTEEGRAANRRVELKLQQY